MGGTFTSNRTENSNQLQLDYLTTNQYHQSVIRGLYSANQHTLAHPGAFIINEGGETQNTNVQIKKTKPLRSLFQIEKNSCALALIPEEADTYDLTFVFTAKADVKITFYLFAQDNMTKIHLPQDILYDEKVAPAQSFSFKKEDKQKFPPNTYLIKTSLYTKDQLCNYNDTYYPLIMMMESEEADQDADVQKFFVYFIFVSEETGYQIKAIRQRVQFGQKSYILDEIYGYGDGATTAADKESKTCSVCLAAKVSTIVLPCKHMCLCYNCAKELKKRPDKRCPICRKCIVSFLKCEGQSRQKIAE